MFDVGRLFRSNRGVFTAVAFAMGMLGMSGFARAQTTPHMQAPVSGATPPAAGPATPESSTRAPSSSSPHATGTPDEDQSASDARSIDLAAQPVAMLAGKADWDKGFQTLMESFGKIRAQMAKAGLKAAGRPLTVFVETDEHGFSYNAMIPVAGAQPGQTDLGNDVTLGTSPAGKAIKFEHQGAYDKIDATYEAITAYLDAKGLAAKNLFVEQYLDDAKGPNDPNLQIDIYVFLKD